MIETRRGGGDYISSLSLFSDRCKNGTSQNKFSNHAADEFVLCSTFFFYHGRVTMRSGWNLRDNAKQPNFGAVTTLHNFITTVNELSKWAIDNEFDSPWLSTKRKICIEQSYTVYVWKSPDEIIWFEIFLILKKCFFCFCTTRKNICLIIFIVIV